MLDVSKDIHSLTDFKRNTAEHLERLKVSGRPAVLTINGQARLVVQDAEAYQKLLEEAEFTATVRAIRKSLDALKRGERGRPLLEVIDQIAAEHGIDLSEA